MVRPPDLTSDKQSAEPPWYRQFHVWLVIAFPAAAVVAGLTLLWISIASYDGLVVDDYYREGLRINAQIERDRAAEAMDLHAHIVVDSPGHQVHVTLQGNATLAPPSSIKVSFLHPVRSDYDMSLVVPMTTPLNYEAPLPTLRHGKWNVLVEAGNWRLLDTLWVSAGS